MRAIGTADVSVHSLGEIAGWLEVPLAAGQSTPRVVDLATDSSCSAPSKRPEATTSSRVPFDVIRSTRSG